MSHSRLVVLLGLTLALAASTSTATATGIPSGAPSAAQQAEPSLPAPQGWPFGERFPRTSGTGRLGQGASFWTDFVYDDHGAQGPGQQTSPASLAPARGTYSYADPNAKGNGADIFRTAIGLGRDATYWRVDWTTLADPKVPIAEWALDTDHNAATGASTWPAGAGVTSPGIEKALVVSSRGAWIVDAVTGARTDVRANGGALTVDPAARSFVVRVPRALLAPTG